MGLDVLKSNVRELMMKTLRFVDSTDVAQPLDPPALSHSSVLMLPSTSALSASSAAISSMISSRLRYAISSPPLGFFTERSKILWSMLLASTLHDLGELASRADRGRASR